MSEQRAFTADWAVVAGASGPELRPNACVVVDGDGCIVEIADAPPAQSPTFDLGAALLLPGLVNAHSHAFQRLIRGRTGHQAQGDPSSFWSWRQAMYAAATSLDPDGFFAATRDCFAEMLSAGITCVGEFHYLHHQADGRPYADPNELSKCVVRAADEVGIRLRLLEVFYERAGAGQAPLPEQRRFCDGEVDAYLRRVDDLRSTGVAVGITAHSVRAVTAQSMVRLADYANTHDLVLHAHVSEQPRENEECVAEHQKSPTQVFADAGCLDRERSFTAVHAVHVSQDDLKHLGRQHVCACPTTEADLGDGIVPASDHVRAGARLAVGSDSNSVIDLVQEARLLEQHERLRTQTRLCLRDSSGRVAPALLDIATIGGAASLGFADGPTRAGRLAVGAAFDAIAVDLNHPSLRDVEPAHALDALMLSGTRAPISGVWVGGERRR
jgi:formimidoylglutamate deiminase